MSSRLSAAIVDPKKALIRTIHELARARRIWEVFRDFVEVSAISLSNAIDLAQRATREERYLSIIKNYPGDDARNLAACLGHLVNALEAGFDDPLGSIFMELELGSHWAGQYFSPYVLASAMARMTLTDIPEDREFVTVMEPAVGSGVMVIALAHALYDRKINFQQRMHVHAVDVDITAVHMAYVQLSLLHIPAIVVHGNALSLVEWSHWRTPAHCLGLWDVKLARRQRESAGRVSPSVDSPIDEISEKLPGTPPRPSADIQMPLQLTLL